jgi:hypothetical protein
MDRYIYWTGGLWAVISVIKNARGQANYVIAADRNFDLAWMWGNRNY